MSVEIQIVVVALLALAVLLLLLLVLRSVPKAQKAAEQILQGDLRAGRQEAAEAARALRDEVSGSLKTGNETLATTLRGIGELQKNQLEGVTTQVKQLSDSNQNLLERIRTSVDTRLTEMREGNEKKLEEMRKTVDEKLHGTLEKRLGESFKLVSDRLEAVQRGLGEMQSLAQGVGDLKRVLTNVKARGTWGEIQLGAILEEILTTDQYDRNVKTKEESGEIVEYAIRLPGTDDRPDSCVWLPIDSKFPMEDYERLLEAEDVADADAVQSARSGLARAVKKSAKDMMEKYINPPRTTDFAIMFLTTEGLYAEVLKQPGLADELQHSYRVVVAGPTTLAAILNALRMGFRTLAIEQRADRKSVV